MPNVRLLSSLNLVKLCFLSRFHPYDYMQESPRQHLLKSHYWSKYTSYQAATCTSEENMEDMLKELDQLCALDRALQYTTINTVIKQVICTHCLEIFKSKHGLLLHIQADHPKFRLAAKMALLDEAQDYIDLVRIGNLKLN